VAGPVFCPKKSQAAICAWLFIVVVAKNNTGNKYLSVNNFLIQVL
jgi:hypothetical protein